MSTEHIASIPEALDAIRSGQIIILVDDDDRENEGDFVFAAQHVSPDKVNFLATYGRGLICIPASIDRLSKLGLEPYPQDRNTALMGTNFTDSVDAIDGVSTGISTADRAKTVSVMADPNSKPSDLARPGHLFPIAARHGGVLERAGHTEGVVDLCKLAGLEPVGVLCEILNEDGTMARMPDLLKLAAQFKMPIATIHDLIAYRRRTETLVEHVVSTQIPNEYGIWTLALYEDIIAHETHTAMIMGEVSSEPTLVRVHSQCFTGDTLGSMRCDCRSQLHAAMKLISQRKQGVILYMHQEGRGIGLKNKLRAYALQDQGHDTVEANEALGFKPDLRDYGIGAQILSHLGLRNICLMTNNPRKVIGLESFGLHIVERVALEVGRNENNERYLETKRTRLGHMLTPQTRI